MMQPRIGLFLVGTSGPLGVKKKSIDTKIKFLY
jgi:hypothetical protein